MEFVIDNNGVLKKIKKVKLTDKKIEIPSGVKEIGNSALFSLKRIEEVTLPPSVEIIGEYAFQECTNLKQINLPNSITFIKRGAFYGCKNLKNIEIPKSVRRIEESCFCKCKKLEEVIILGLIDTLESYTFDECENLKSVTLPKSLRKVESFAFVECNSMERLIINNKENLKELELWYFMDELENYYINNKTNEILISKNNLEIMDFQRINYEEYKKLMNCSNNTAVYASMFLDIKIIERYEFLKMILSKIINASKSVDDINDIKEKIEKYKEFENLTRRLVKNGISCDSKNWYSLYRFASTLGAYCDEQKERQRACEFIFLVIDKKILKLKDINTYFNNLLSKKYKKEWTRLFIDRDNFKRLLKLEKEQPGFISRVYNSFEQIKEYGRSNRGSQNYREVTIDMCIEYLSKITFDKVDERTKDIEKELSKYTRNQETFDTASEIRNEYLRLKANGEISDHILNKELKEIRKVIIENISDIKEDLNYVIEDLFTYEFLSKYDARNFVLGKYCSCCAHLEGLGSGIVKATVINPNCQNLVINGENGEIIAKSTMYINKEQGYIVFNNVEINNNVVDKEGKNLIYKKYMKGIEDFVKTYNEENPENPIHQVNVGMGRNGLTKQLEKNHKYSKEILRGIDFSFYEGYKGDWQDKQIVLWEDKSLKKGDVRHGR